jgi:hypothetical protein
MTDTLIDLTAHNGAFPSAFTVRRRYIVVEWDNDEMPEYLGFAAKVRSNLRNDERREFLDRLYDYQMLAINQARARLNGTDVPEGDSDELVFALIAPHIIAWNARAERADGTEVPIPPPAEGGTASLWAVEFPMAVWLKDRLADAYRGGKGVRKSSSEPGNGLDGALPSDPS